MLNSWFYSCLGLEVGPRYLFGFPVRGPTYLKSNCWKWQGILGEPWPAMLGMHPILYGVGNGRARGCLLASLRSVDREGSPCPCASPRTDEASFKQFLVQVMKANVASEDATEAWLEYRIFDLMDGLGGPASKNIPEILMQGWSRKVAAMVCNLEYWSPRNIRC